jgi:hypothetical protein
MKKLYLFLFAFVLITSAYGQEKTGLEIEKEAIKAVILEETQSYCDKDFDRFAATYKHDESIVDLRAFSTSYSHGVGWEALSSGMKNIMTNNPEPIENTEVKENFDIHVYTNSAWAVFENVFYNDEGILVDMDIGVNFLEKIDGEWKIVYLSRVGATSYSGDFEEIEVAKEVLSKYLGKYELQPGFILEIILEGSQLYVLPTGQQRQALFAYEENKFFLRMINAQVEFNFEDDKVVSLTLHQNGENLALKVD